MSKISIGRLSSLQVFMDFGTSLAFFSWKLSFGGLSSGEGEPVAEEKKSFMSVILFVPDVNTIRVSLIYVILE